MTVAALVANNIVCRDEQFIYGSEFTSNIGNIVSYLPHQLVTSLARNVNAVRNPLVRRQNARNPGRPVTRHPPQELKRK